MICYATSRGSRRLSTNRIGQNSDRRTQGVPIELDDQCDRPTCGLRSGVLLFGLGGMLFYPLFPAFGNQREFFNADYFF